LAVNAGVYGQTESGSLFLIVLMRRILENDGRVIPVVVEIIGATLPAVDVVVLKLLAALFRLIDP
jgi:hypothetical protein